MAIPTQSVANAINAYANVSKGVGSGAGINNVAQPNTFGGLVQNAIQNAINVSKQGEVLSMAAINDTADLNQVVTAVTEAELMLQTVTSVRDKVIEAYKEIIRMPI